MTELTPDTYPEGRKPRPMEDFDHDSEPYMMVSLTFPLWSGISFNAIAAMIHPIVHALEDVSYGERSVEWGEMHAVGITLDDSTMPVLISGRPLTDRDDAAIAAVIKAAKALHEHTAELKDAQPTDFGGN